MISPRGGIAGFCRGTIVAMIAPMGARTPTAAWSWCRPAHLLLCLLGAAAAPAQSPEPPSPRPVEIVLQNLAPLSRREGVAVVVPFARGEVHELPNLHVPDTPTAWQPFGARWPDGSLRQALCLFQAELGPLAERRLRLAAGPGPPLPTGPITAPALRLEFVAQVGGASTRAEPVPVQRLEENALRVVELRRARLGTTGLLAELILTTWRDQPHAHADVAVWFSDPRLSAMQCDVDELAIECQGVALALRHAAVLAIDQEATANGSRTVLLRRRPLGDGQGLRRAGVLVPRPSGDAATDRSAAAAALVPLIGAADWRGSGAFGPFGKVPEPPPWLAGSALREHLARSWQRFVASQKGPGDPFAVFEHGLARMAGQTGDQADFGVVKLSLVAASGLPSPLLEVERSVLQEACRPVHFFEADGAPVDPAAHPEWVVWSGRTHWHAGVSKDRLGKPVPEPRFSTHGWTGKDREHWSSNYLSAFALLTGAHWARAELANEARLYVAGQTVAPGWSTSNAGAPRGAGRTALAAAWNLLVTDDAALRARMHERMDLVEFPQWAGRELPPDAVRPMAVNPPDARMLQGCCPYWNPWQDATAAFGFAAHHLVTGNANARVLAEALATNVVRHGWLLTAGEHDVAAALRWQDGVPITTADWLQRDPKLVQGSAGTAFVEWASPALEIARVVAERDGDEALLAKCREIQRRLRSARRPPPDGGMDRFGEWDAVAWPPR